MEINLDLIIRGFAQSLVRPVPVQNESVINDMRKAWLDFFAKV